MAAAFELSEGDWRERHESITVYQRGWRLGGKGASGRGPSGRIEEHGFHVLLGYYEHTFDLMRRCYTELDRRRSDPLCPIQDWDQAVFPSNDVGVAGRDDQSPWVASFSFVPERVATRGRVEFEPGETTVADAAVRSLHLLLDFFGSLRGPAPPAPAVRLATSPPTRRRDASPGGADVLRGSLLVGLAAGVAAAERIAAIAGSAGGAGLQPALARLIEPLRTAVREAVERDPAARRARDLVELVTANLAGIASDRLLTRPEGFGAIDSLDYRAWLRGNGIAPEALASPLLRGMYDLVFAYEDADPSRPRFSAGLGLQLATRMLFGYRGALFWKMRAGMGDVVFAPLYQVLRSRGVEFRFFHRVDALRLSPDRRRIGAIELGIQAEATGGAASYDPLVRVRGLPSWPSRPREEQLRDPSRIAAVDTESFWSERRDARRLTLVEGTDFDAVVFAISVGMVPYVCPDLLEASPRWRAMADHLGTVATQSLQVWLRTDERGLGWLGPPGGSVSGLPKPFDTWASMSHLISAEDWGDSSRPRSIAYFCGPLRRDGDHPSRAAASVEAGAREFLDRGVTRIWPAAAGDRGFRWGLLCDNSGATGSGRLAAQYWRANVDPSDLYVQSLPGTGRFRIRPGATGFDNLVIAGDWTDCGLNAGCVEAAVLSGRLAARAVGSQRREASSVPREQGSPP